MEFSGATVIQLLFSAGVTTVVVTIINGFLQRRKMGADTTKIITDAASGVLTRIEDDNKRLRTDDSKNRTRIDQLEDYIDEGRGVINRHIEWDELVVRRAKAVDLYLPDPPPLKPPPLPPES